MLLTPLGAIKLFVNDEEVGFTAIKLDNLELHCLDVNGGIQHRLGNDF